MPGMNAPDWQQRYIQELARARQARSDGNEGMARVCARRAVGELLGEYFQRRGIPVRTPSAYDRLHLLVSLPDVEAQVKTIAEHFLLRITPEHTLPVEADLIAEADWLAQALLPGTRSAD